MVHLHLHIRAVHSRVTKSVQTRVWYANTYMYARGTSTRQVHPRVSTPMHEVHARVWYTYTYMYTRNTHEVKTREVHPRVRYTAVFLPSLLSYCFSEGDLWFTRDDRTIILCTHSLEKQRENAKNVGTNENCRISVSANSFISRWGLIVQRLGVKK